MYEGERRPLQTHPITLFQFSKKPKHSTRMVINPHGPGGPYPSLLYQCLHERIFRVAIELDIDLGRHVVREIDKHLTAS